MNNLFKMNYLPVILALMFIISGCTKDESALNSTLKVSNITAISSNDMIGHWELSGMIADTEIDLNSDNHYNKNLLNETSCFNTMSITFNEDGTFISNNAQMTFESGASNNEFFCLSDRMDDGEWEVSNNSLILTFLMDGKTYTHKKVIDLASNKFSLEVTKLESDQYVNDPGDTQASPIRILELEYTKS
ncbi:DUF5004 domain-containing protein [Gramella lutea]|uniref:DUF5004 domain-containing protein n=1 Tax=Christiangramia lutea TaxID=1607951 RepID=A0A9X2A870_9FLAO|nr:lipocalin family protein [Christiangramia lutea]MCH4821995.1 DUF5004 domain-containing protein [Christiangramia lutea]